MRKPHITFREYVEMREGMGQPINPGDQMAQQKIIGQANNIMQRNPNLPIAPALNKAAMVALNTKQVTPGQVQQTMGDNNPQQQNQQMQMRMMKKAMKKRMKKKMERM